MIHWNVKALHSQPSNINNTFLERILHADLVLMEERTLSKTDLLLAEESWRFPDGLGAHGGAHFFRDGLAARGGVGHSQADLALMDECTLSESD